MNRHAITAALALLAALMGFATGSLLRLSSDPSPPVERNRAVERSATFPRPAQAEREQTTKSGNRYQDDDEAAVLRQAILSLGPFGDAAMLTDYFRRLARLDPARAAALFRSLDPGAAAARQISKACLEEWASLDTEAAADFAKAELGRPPSPFRGKHLLVTMANADPAGAFEAALATPISGLEALGEIVKLWCRADLASASEALARLSPGPALREAAVAVTKERLLLDPASAPDWLLAQPDNIRAAVGLVALLNRDPSVPRETYFTLLADQLHDFGHADDASTALRRAKNASGDPGKRASAIADLSNAIDRHVSDLRAWAREDLASATAWTAAHSDRELAAAMDTAFARNLAADGRLAEAIAVVQDEDPAIWSRILVQSTLSAHGNDRDATRSALANLPEPGARDAMLDALRSLPE